MKKTFRKLKITVSLIVVFSLLFSCGILTLWEAEQQERDFVFSSNVDDLGDDIVGYYYGKKTSDDTSSDNLNQESGKGTGLLTAFYLSHMENHYAERSVGFYSTLWNSKGEVVAKYQPYVIFEKDINDESKEDVRVLVLGDEFSEAFHYTGNIETEEERYNFDARDILENISVYDEKTEYWYPLRDCLKVDGVCDDDMVYLGKLTWYDSISGKTYTYSPKEKQTHKGTMNFDDWLDYKNNDVCVCVSEDVRYICNSNTKYNLEAKEVCEQNLDNYKINQMLGDNYSENVFTVIRSNTRVFYDKNSDEYYILSVARVNHPLIDAINNLYFEYLIALAIAVILIVFINVLFSKKRKLLEKAYMPIEENNNETDTGNINYEDDEITPDEIKEG